MKFKIPREIEQKFLDLKDMPDVYFLSSDFWVFTYDVCTSYNDWSLLRGLQSFTKKLADGIPVETISKFYDEWKLPNDPDPTKLPSRSLATTNSKLFEQIKRLLKRNGEGTHCWACRISVDDNRKLPANTKHIGLSAHEWWDWDEVHFVRKLVAVRFLCFDCHYLTGRDAIWTLKFGKLAEKDIGRIKRFCVVNNCTVPQMWAQMQHARVKWQRLNKTDINQWNQDVSIIDTLMTNQ
jgi:hypothetical protein